MNTWLDSSAAAKGWDDNAPANPLAGIKYLMKVQYQRMSDPPRKPFVRIGPRCCGCDEILNLYLMGTIEAGNEWLKKHKDECGGEFVMAWGDPYEEVDG